MAPGNQSQIPLDVVLKAVVDKTGSQPVKDFLKEYADSTKAAEDSVSRTSQLLDKMGAQMGHMMDPLRHFGGMIGMAGLGAVYHQYLQATTYGAQAALAQGNVTGGSGTFQPYTQALLGVQAKTGVQAGSIEEGLRTAAQMAGSSLSAEGASRFGALLAGASLTSGMSPQAVSQIVGSFLQSSGMSAGVGAGLMGTSNATALLAGVNQALSAFPGSQKEAILPMIAGLYGAQALGAGAGGPASGAAGMAAFANMMAQANPLFRNPGNLEAGAGAIGGAIQGSIASGPMLAIMHAAGLSFGQIREGFTPENAVKLAAGLEQLWPEPEGRSVREFQLFGPAGTKELEEIQRIGPQRWMARQRAAGRHPNIPAYQRELENAILGHTPEAALSKTQAGVEKGLFGNPIVQWMGASPLHMALGGAGLMLGMRGLGALAGGIGRTALGSASSLIGGEGLAIGAGDIAGGAITGGVLPTLLSLIDPGGELDLVGKLTGGGLGATKAMQRAGLTGYEGNVVQEALRRGGGQRAMEAWVRSHAGHAGAEGVVPGGSSAHMLGMLHETLGLERVPQVLREVEGKYGPGFWHMDKKGEEASAFIRQRLSGKGLTAISELMKEERKYNALGPQGYWASKQGESINQFSQAVDKFSQAVHGGGNKNAAYLGGAHTMNASFAQAALSTAPGMMYAAFMGGGHMLNASFGGTPSGIVNAAYITPGASNPSSAWEKVLRAYSGGGYGLSYVQQLAHERSGGGMHPHDRAIVEADAKKYGVPFSVLWGIYGAESSFGKAASNFGLTGQYPGTGTSGNFASDARISAEDLAKLFKEMQVHVHVSVDGHKAHRNAAKVKHVAVMHV